MGRQGGGGGLGEGEWPLELSRVSLEGGNGEKPV